MFSMDKTNLWVGRETLVKTKIIEDIEWTDQSRGRVVLVGIEPQPGVEFDGQCVYNRNDFDVRVRLVTVFIAYDTPPHHTKRLLYTLPIGEVFELAKAELKDRGAWEPIYEWYFHRIEGDDFWPVAMTKNGETITDPDRVRAEYAENAGSRYINWEFNKNIQVKYRPLVG